MKKTPALLIAFGLCVSLLTACESGSNSSVQFLENTFTDTEITTTDTDIEVVDLSSVTTEEVTKASSAVSTNVPPPTTWVPRSTMMAVEDADTTFPMLSGAVYVAYDVTDTQLSNPIAVYSFKSETAGALNDPKDGTGTPFSYEQSGSKITFHFGSLSNTTNAELSYDADAQGTLKLSIANGGEYLFYLVPGADPLTYVDSFFATTEE